MAHHLITTDWIADDLMETREANGSVEVTVPVAVGEQVSLNDSVTILTSDGLQLTGGEVLDVNWGFDGKTVDLQILFY